MNSSMHVVEAFWAAFDATGDAVWRDRALGISQHMVAQARRDNWRIIEHFDEEWRPLLEYNADDKANPFRPYGSTIGHWFERSEEHTSELQSRGHLVCRLLLEKK